MTKKLCLLLVTVVVSSVTIAQVTVTNPTNTIPNLAASYGTLSAAITALNSTSSISGPVVISLSGNETAPLGGYSITAAPAGVSATNNITIEGSSSTLTAFGGQSAGVLSDAIFKLLGADYITIQNFTMQENAANTTTIAASNNMTEWGVALLYATTGNGAQNNIIQNNTISLNKSYTNTWAIYSNVRHSPANVLATADIVNSTTAPNKGNKVYGNNISNVNMGIAFIGSATAANQDSGNDIGGSSLSTGNTISNWGGAAATSAYVSNSGSTYCIFMNHQVGENVSYNTITSATISGTSVPLRGIYKDYTNTGASISGTTNINQNTITITDNFTSGILECIRTQGTASNTSTLNLNDNTILNSSVGGASASTMFSGIVNSEVVATLNINNNIIRGTTSTATTGGFMGISNSGAVTSTINMDNNQIGNASGGAITFSAANNSTCSAISNVGGAATCALTMQSNDIRGITYSVASSAPQLYILNSAATLSQNISNNTFTNLSVSTTGSVTFLSNSVSLPSGGSATIDNNSIVSGFSKTGAGGTVTLFFTNNTPTSLAGTTKSEQNNNFSNITLTGATTMNGWADLEGAAGGGATKTISGNTFNNWTCGSGAVTVIQTNLSGTGSTVSSNTITNISGTGTITGISNGSGNGGTSMNVSNNTISGLNSTSTGGAVSGITGGSTGTTTLTISGNNINSLSTSGASAVNGLTISNSSATIATQNKIYDLAASSASGTTNGITVSGGSDITLSNNLIGNLTAPSSTNANGVIGINLSSSTVSSSLKVYFNTVYLSGGGGSNFGSSAIYHVSSTTATTAALDLRNNVLVNNCTPDGTGLAVAFRRSSGALGDLANYASTSDYNLFYAGVLGGSGNQLIYDDGNGSERTLGGYKAGGFIAGTLSPRDQNSVTEDPEFQGTNGSDPNFLKFKTDVAKYIESRSLNIAGITTDYASATRAGNGGYSGTGTAPDLGAWELEGIPIDTYAPIITYTGISDTHCVSDQTLSSVTITDVSGVNTTVGTRPRLYFKKAGNSNDFDDNTSSTDGWKYVEASGSGNSPFSFTTDYSLLFGGAPVAGDVIEYFVIAQDLATMPNVGVNSGSLAASPSSIDLSSEDFPIGGTLNRYSILNNGLSGTVTIGATGDYPSLTGAGGLFSAINSNGLRGNLIADIIDASVAEDGSNALNEPAYLGCSVGTFSITIKPNTTATLSGSVASGALIKINGADYVTIDGSNSGGTDRSLTITNTSSSSPTAISFVSLGTGAGATSNTLKNCNISTSTTTVVSFGITIGGNTPGATGADNDNVTIQNNAITGVHNGIYAFGTASVSSGANDNLLISGNDITINSSNENKGLWLGNSINSTVTENTISVQTSHPSAPVGISIGTGFVSSIVHKNKITHVYASSGQKGGRGITVATGTANSNLTISNNVIYGVNGTNSQFFGSSTTMGIGIGVNGTSFSLSSVAGGIKLYYNTVHISGSMGSSSSTAITAALYIGSGASALDIRNNIFTNTQAGTATTQKNYAVYSVATNTAFEFIDHNDYYVFNNFYAPSATLGFLGTDITNLASWQSATGQDANSISTNPTYGSDSDLRPESPGLVAGTPLSINTDITGASRDLLTPVLGAYDSIYNLNRPAFSYTGFIHTSCLSDRTLTPVTITDIQLVDTTSGTRPRLYFKKLSNADTYVDNTAGTDGWKYVEASGSGNSPFSFTTNYSLLFGGTPVLGDVIQYFMVAQDLYAVPQVGISSGSFAATPTSVNLSSAAFPIGGTVDSYSLQAAMPAGIVTIGAAGDYSSLTQAGGLFSAINSLGLSGDLTVQIIDATVTEDASNALNVPDYVGCAAGPYSITIKPNTTATLTGSVDNEALIKINGADYVTFDGSISGGTDRSLTIYNTGTTASSGICFKSLGTGSGASYNTVKNCNISTAISTGVGYGISVGGNPGAAGADNDYITIQNNEITGPMIGIFVNGTAATISGSSNNLLVSGNNINLISTADVIGILIRYSRNSLVTGNTISVETSGAVPPVGISLETGFISSTVDKNTITKVLATHTGGWGGRGITVGIGYSSTNLTISNNLIYGVNGSNWNTMSKTSIGIGIGVYSNTSTLTTSAGGVNLYHNTVSMTGSMGSASSTAKTAALYVGTGASTLDIRNNIFSNTQTGTNASQKNYAVYSHAPNSDYSIIDYNDYFVSNSFNTASAFVGFLGSDQTTVADWRTVSGQDVNSMQADPLFISGTDLHLLPCSPMEASGAAIGSVTSDFDGETRNASTPDIGADEFNTLLFDAPTNVNACNSYTLPALTSGDYFDGPGGTGTAYSAGNVISSNMTMYVYAESGTTPNCIEDQSFTITIDSPVSADASGDVTTCNFYTLPALSSGNYFSGSGGTGTAYNAGDDILSSRTMYIYATNGVCSDENSFNITINNTPNTDAPSNVTACDSYTLPALTVGNYFDGPAGTGTAYTAGNVISSSKLMYVYAETGTTPNCSYENSFTITINNTPIADSPANVTACDSYILPALTVGNYFTGSGGTGTALFAGNVISSSQTIYVYAANGVCTDENSFTLTVYDCSQLAGPSCGATLSNLTDALHFDLVAGATNYRFLVEHTPTAFAAVSTKGNGNDNLFRLSWLSAAKYGTSYTVKVSAFVGGSWQPYGNACTVTTPPTRLTASSCGAVLTNLTDAVNCFPVAGATNYRFLVTHAGSAFNKISYSNSATNAFFRMSWFSSGVQPGTTYTVQAAAYVGGSWQTYGPSCTITTPSQLTQLKTASCNVNIPALSTALYSDKVTGATNYRYEVVNVAAGFSKVSTRNAADTLFRLSWVSGIQLNTTYTVRVSAYLNGVWQAYGPACTVTTPAAIMADEEVVQEHSNGLSFGEELRLETYPNPNNGEFTIRSSHEGRFNIINELGQLIQTLEIKKENAFQTQVEGLGAGVYFVTGTINNEVITKKVVVQ